MIRITGGEDRSRLLEVPSTGLTKPTMDKVRQAVFSALSYDIYGKEVLDLFAGSGSYGFESLSRGAKHATFVDCQADAITSIKRNAQALRKEEQSTIVSQQTETFVNGHTGQFDIIFMDPPYKFDKYSEVVKTLISREIIKDNGIIVLESDKEIDINEALFKEVRAYKHGLARVYILRK